MPICLAVRTARSGTAILSGLLHLQAYLESSKTTSLKLEEFFQSLAETHSISASKIHLIMRVHLIMRGINGVKKQKRKKVKLLLWKTETLQPPVPRPLVESWEQREIFAVFPAFILVFSRCQWWHSSVHTRLGIYNRFQWECAYWEMCPGPWQAKGEQFKDYFIWVCAVSWQLLSLQLQGPELNEFPIKNGLCISKDMPIADAASSCSLFSLSSAGRENISQEFIHPGTLINNSKRTR